ncbi:GNAT family N-acetyltransferase [Chryseobacterium sp. MFBS3-17]|uniref:GNAT family N-acetyltransferase n=1 Tax=Chryseobacterium sp. MFBS3-17 TaxID=2886689 RepID=UPI001D0F3ED9|nr:GNAT family protein [Chryseobacterium sp. MFBS3-17]MCC2591068.1 GNAT family N-acetyltransferase [Chryseobacterium sp. MFBS3-17]
MNFPELQTERLILNQPRESDRESLMSCLNADQVYAENTLNIPFPYQKKDADFFLKDMVAKGFEQQSQIIFAIRKITDDTMTGSVGLHLAPGHRRAELGYWLARGDWNKGYVTEAVNAVIEFGFTELDLNKIIAIYYTTNPASGRILEKCGFKLEALLRQEYMKNGSPKDANRYAILREDYRATHSAASAPL